MIYLVNKYFVYWSNISLEKPIAIFPTHYWINGGGALRETVGISNMYNECRFCHIGTDYPFTETKDSIEVKG